MKALIVTDLSFPIGSAMSSRLKTFCSLFKELGYDCHVIAGKTDDKSLEYGKTYFENDYSYEIVYSKRSEKLQSYIGNENLVGKVNEYLNNNEISFVFFNSLGALFNKVLKVCKKHNVKTILEQCEWYDPSSFRFDKYDPRYIRFNDNIKNNYKKVNGLICISRLLNDYYLSLNCKSIRIPSLFDVNNMKWNDNNNSDVIKLIYTGNTGKSKEALKPILEALKGKYKKTVTLDIYGIKEDDVIKNIGSKDIYEETKKYITIHGRVSYDELITAICKSDYQIFIKPNRRSANAQFPTKLAESMACGTPIICNKTGDIPLYIKDGINGFTGNNLNELFDRITKISKKDYNNLRIKARETALASFDYRKYIGSVKELIDKI